MASVFGARPHRVQRARFTVVVLAVLSPLLEACAETPPPPPAPPPSPTVAAIADASREEAAANAALAANQPSAALAPATRAVEICRRSLGAAHPETWRALELLSLVHERMERLDLVEQPLLEAIAGRETALGPRDLSLAAPLDRLARAQDGQRERAESLRRRALTIRVAVLGPQHRDLVVPLVELAALLRRACRIPETESLLRQAWDIATRTLGASRPEMAQVLAEIAELRWENRDDAGARQQWARAIAILEGNEAADPGRLVKLLLRLADHEDDLTTRKALQERALAVADRQAGTERAAHHGAILSLGQTLRAMGDDAGALALERRVWAVVRARPAKPPTPSPAPATPPSTTEKAGPRCAHPPAVSGGSVTNAAAVVAGMAAAFRRCYNKGLTEDPNMKGAVRITAKVDRDGDVVWAGASVTGGLSEAVVSCLADRVLNAAFAPPEGGGATVVIPITLVTQ